MPAEGPAEGPIEGPAEGPETGPRRPLKTRSAAWASALARALASAGFTPNAISAAGLSAALVGAVALCAGLRLEGPPAPRILLLVAAAACIQLRLLCNLLDGLVAVEGGLAGPTGELWNDLPDRLADLALLSAAGHGLVGMDPRLPVLGWAAGALAVLIAYLRVLGRSLGAGTCWLGPMAKPHRMATLTLGCLLAAGATGFGVAREVLVLTLGVILLGGVATFLRRLRHIVRALG